MRIRSITSFLDPDPVRFSEQINLLAQMSQQLADDLATAGFEVQTRRLATTPFPLYTAEMDAVVCSQWMTEFEQQANHKGFAYVSFGPALPEFPESYERLPEMMRRCGSSFYGAVIADRFQVYPQAIQATAKVIVEAANIDPNGFANLQLAALANVLAGVPFFPAGYAAIDQAPSFALAMECADVVQQAFSGGQALSVCRQNLLNELEEAARKIEVQCRKVERKTGVQFKGFDFSAAPYPADDCSLGAALEAVGGNILGRDGMLAAAAVIADTLDSGSWPRAGFNGLMMPVLEDSTLARRAAEGTFSVRDLLLYSAVCGTGLDTVPLPGDCSAEEVAAILFDVAALGVRLGKPLTARLMPIPGKKAGEATNFHFDYFAPSRVMAIVPGKVSAPLNGEEALPLMPRYLHKRMQK